MTAIARSHFPMDVGCDLSQVQPVALDDLVPSDSTVAVIEPQFCHEPPHFIEGEVQRALLASPELHFASLVVHRVEDGVCLEGVLDANDDAPDVGDLARQIAGVQHVINRLLILRPRASVRRPR